MDEKHFRSGMNANAMAPKMLSPGIRGFEADLKKLRAIVKQKFG